MNKIKTNLKKEKVVVTGGAGFIGSHVVDGLIGKGFDVHVIDNLSGGKKENINDKSTFHEVDIRDLDAIMPIVSGSKYVFHLAALPRVQYSIENPLETNEVNVKGTLNILVSSKEGGVERVIYSGSSSAYGDQEIMPLREDMLANPLSPYGLQKYIGELSCKTWSDVYNLETVSLRYFNAYGPRQDPDGAYALVIGKFLKQKDMDEKITITGDGEQTRDFTYVGDVARANILASESEYVGNGEVINIGAGNNASINTVAKLIGGPIVYVEARLEPKHTLADISKAKKLLGWEPEVSLEEGLKLTIDYDN